MARKHWEEMGWSTEWYYDQHRMRRDRLDDAELNRILLRHGAVATAELAMLAGSGNFNRYVEALARINAALDAEAVVAATASTADLPLFASL